MKKNRHQYTISGRQQGFQTISTIRITASSCPDSLGSLASPKPKQQKMPKRSSSRGCDSPSKPAFFAFWKASAIGRLRAMDGPRHLGRGPGGRVPGPDVHEPRAEHPRHRGWKPGVQASVGFLKEASEGFCTVDLVAYLGLRRVWLRNSVWLASGCTWGLYTV